METYKVTVDGRTVYDGLSYREACELASEIDADPRYNWNEVDVLPDEGGMTEEADYGRP